jgi:hypothetical protein
MIYGIYSNILTLNTNYRVNHVSKQAISHIEDAQIELETEYRRTKTEEQAFRNFRDQITELEAAQPRVDRGSAIPRL